MAIFGVPYHRQKRDPLTGRVLPISICPACAAEFEMVQKDWESHQLSPQAVAHVQSHTEKEASRVSTPGPGKHRN